MSDKYQDIPEEDRKKAQTFFERGRAVSATGNFEYAIEMFMQGLEKDPENVHAHMELRDISLKRKVSGGKPMGFFDARKYPVNGKDLKANFLNSERHLAYDPGSTDYMSKMFQHAHKGGFFDTVMWIGPILYKANMEVKKPEFNKFIILKDVYKDIASDQATPHKIRASLWKQATEACQRAFELHPDDMDLQRELKDLGAAHTMDEGGYAEGASFRDSIRNRDEQDKLMAQDKDFQDTDTMKRFINEAEAQYRADPVEGKALRLADTYEKTEDPDYENKATELMSKWFEKTKQFRFRKRIGDINMRQWNRMDRGQREYLEKNPKDAQAIKDYQSFLKDKIEFELSEYLLCAENYPTDMVYRYSAAKCYFALRRYDEAIPMLQDARRDAKFRVGATIMLGRAFFEAQFLDESIDTLESLIKEYQLRGDDQSKDMLYWCGRAHEARGDTDVTIKLYSQIVQMEFNFRDVQKRIRELRNKGSNAAGGGQQ